MNDFDDLSSMQFSIPTDDDGFTGRECPNPNCQGFFKIKIGTGLAEGSDCICPYCGYKADHDNFFTEAQNRYIESVIMRAVHAAIDKTFKKALNFRSRPSRAGLSVSLTYKSGAPVPIHYYIEEKLETEFTCDACGLQYAVFGVFAFCPDCGCHNSLQTLRKSLDIVAKLVDLASGQGESVATRLLENALEDCVSSFDGFGRELCRLYASKAINPSQAESIRFQNLTGTHTNLLTQFRIDMTTLLIPAEWDSVVRCFLKRHVLSHKMGVIDQEYVTRSGDSTAVIGRRLVVTAAEVKRLTSNLLSLATQLSQAMNKLV